MSDVIQLSSDDEDNKPKPDKLILTRKTSNQRKSGKPKGVTEANVTTVKKENSTKGMVKSKGSNVNDCLTGESGSSFQQFLKTCHNTEVTKRNGDSKLMTTILDKLTRRYKDADPEYTQSETFREAVNLARNLVENDPSNLFVHMKQVGDELKLRCVKSKNSNHKRKLGGEENIVPKKRSKTSANDESEDEEEELGKEVNKGHCNKLENIFEKVYRKVKKLEAKEVDWDAEENSEYIRLERYKKRLYDIWEKWQEVRGRLDEVKKLKHRKIAFSGTGHLELDHAIEKFVNKTKCFPDFMDIYKLTSETLKKNMKLELNEDQMKSIASSAFKKLGNQLQKVRLFEFWNGCMSYLPSASDSNTDVCDPADKDEDLARALKENRLTYTKKLSDVFDSFVTKQVDGKHEPEEVILGTDDEGSAPSEDDEDEEEPEEENPEDIIYISSSSSEDSPDETESDIKQSKSDGSSHSTNGNLSKIENKIKSGHKSESEETADYIGCNARIKEESPVCVRKVKVKAGEESVKMESVASCSSGQKKAKTPSHSDVSRNKKTKAVGNMEVVILSESDSGE